jgi:ABC-type proline/glycine betaine transport system permease subunit
MLNSLIQSCYLITENSGWLDVILNPFKLYTIPLGDWITVAVNFIVDNFRPLFQAIRFPIGLALEWMESAFLSIPPLIFLIVIGLVVWQLAGQKIASYSVVIMLAIGFLGTWEPAMVTLSLMVTAVAICVVVGIPLGIACARSDRLNQIIQPILDTMQTLPIFIYLVPIVMLFGIGQVPGVIATFIVAVPPQIRLTNMGIRQVSTEVIEAAQAFGSTPLQVLWEVQIPLAIPTILAGVNQTIMMALSMVVVASMIAVKGLGLMVLQSVSRMDIGTGTVGGLGIVLLAIMLDRITQAMGNTNNISWKEQGPIGFILSRLKPQKTSDLAELTNPQ